MTNEKRWWAQLKCIREIDSRLNMPDSIFVANCVSALSYGESLSREAADRLEQIFHDLGFFMDIPDHTEDKYKIVSGLR